MKRVLMVVHLYPPGTGSSGVLRPLKFSRFLPACGWTPHVLTLRESRYRGKDPSLLAQVPPEAVLHRTWALDNSRDLAIRGRYLGVLSIPDSHVAWLPFAVARGLAVARREKIDALYSTSPPPTAHLIAAVINRVTGIPWVADFRDPWIEDGIHPKPGSRRFRVESALERHVVERADVVTATTAHLRGDFLRRYPHLPPDKVVTLTNGYDEEDFEGLGGGGAPERFEIMHAGLVNREFRDPRPLLRAVAGLIAEGALPRQDVRVSFLGIAPWLRSAEFTHDVQALGLQDVVALVPRVPHREALAVQDRAAALLLLQASDDTTSMIPAKAFEYLRLGLPIIALAYEGATSDVLKGMEACFVVHPEDDAGLRRAITTLHASWRANPDGLRATRAISAYERRALTGELGRLLDRITSPRARAGRRSE
jgi:glycosyltransferase involved in cell wall biosynthesis